MQARSLKTEFLTNPLGLDETAPRLGWQLPDGPSCPFCQIRIRREGQEFFWDSGRIPLPENCRLPYPGAQLAEFTRYQWQVRLWFDSDLPGDWSEEAFFETGFMGRPWPAQWITGISRGSLLGPSTRFRREFHLSAAPVRARLAISALGVYTPQINRQRLTENTLMPGYTAYESRVQYQVYDVTKALHAGDNAIGVEVADGWYKGAIARIMNQGNPTYGDRTALLAILRIECADGTFTQIGTDTDWHYSEQGPCRAADLYHGETYDARLQQPGWSAAHFDADGWFPANELSTAIRVEWNSGLPVRRMHLLAPQTITQDPSGRWIVDFGQNLVGRERLQIHAPRHCRITVRHGEMLEADGSLYTANLRSATATTTYISNGEAQEYEPEFTFYGFRYLEIDGWPGELDAGEVQAAVLYSAMERTGHFECSEPLLNQLYRNVLWGQRGNYLDIPTDCPQRDERQGWTGDAQVFMPTAAYNYDVSAFFTKWLTDLNLSRLPNGDYPPFAPFPRNTWGFEKGAAGWADAGIICPWTQYLFFGDRRILARFYPQMRHFVEQMRLNSNGLIRTSALFKDWLNIDAETTEELISTAFFAHSTQLLAKIAGVLNLEADAEQFNRLFEEIRDAYRRRFFSPQGELLEKTQTAAVLSLHFDLVPPPWRAQVADALEYDIRHNRQMHLSTGFLGTPHLAEVLSQCGKTDTAYNLVLQTSYPGWLYPVTQGATTIWERWNSWTRESGFGDIGMNSFNHYAYGAVAQWFYGYIVGIRPLESHPGFSRFTLAPEPGTRLEYAQAELQTSAGRIRSAWRRVDDDIEFEFHVPAGSVAELRLPGEAAISELPPGSHHRRKRLPRPR